MFNTFLGATPNGAVIGQKPIGPMPPVDKNKLPKLTPKDFDGLFGGPRKTMPHTITVGKGPPRRVR